MSRYNTLINTHFGGCKLLANGFDEHRGRPVKVFMIPGDFSIVGVTDSVDSWIAPASVAPSALFDNVRRVLHDIQQGKHVEIAQVDKPRVRVQPAGEAQKSARVRVTVTGRHIDEEQEAARLLNTALDQQQTILPTRRRIHVHS